MRILSIILLAGLIASIQAGVIKTTKTSVNFSGFGKYITENTVKIQADRKAEDSNNEFKGEGFLGNITAKLILKPGEERKITALDEMKLYKLNPENKQYTVAPIQKIEMDSGENGENETDTEEGETMESDEESTVRVIRNEFRVSDLGEHKTINDFPCDKYLAEYIYEWEDTETGEHQTDSLATVVWTTPETGDLKTAYDEEMAFNNHYMKKIGLTDNELMNDVLGTRWMKLFSQLNQSKQQDKEIEDSQFAAELGKIKGYPVVTDGKYYVIDHSKNSEENSEEQQAESEESKPKTPKGIFGSFMKKALDKSSKQEKSKEKEEKPAFSFYNELVNVKTEPIDKSELTVPEDYTNATAEE